MSSNADKLAALTKGILSNNDGLGESIAKADNRSREVISNMNTAAAKEDAPAREKKKEDRKAVYAHIDKEDYRRLQELKLRLEMKLEDLVGEAVKDLLDKYDKI